MTRAATNDRLRSNDWWLRSACVVAALGVLVAHVAYRPVADPDMFHEMALIREAIALGRIPLEDRFAYTPTIHPVVHHEWGTGAMLYTLWQVTHWGPNGIILGHFIIVALIAAVAFACALRKGGDLLTAALLSALVVPLLDFGLAPIRAQMLTYLFLALMLYLLPDRSAPGLGTVMLWLLLYVCWVNVHGGFVVGAGLFGLYTAERLIRSRQTEHSWNGAVRQHAHVLGALAVMPLLLLATPYGRHYPAYLWRALSMDRPRIGEWAPLWDMTYVEPTLLAPFALTILILLYVLLRVRDRRSLYGLPMILAALLATVQHQRLAPVYAIVWLAFVPGYLTHTPLAALLERDSARVRAGVVTAAAVALVAAVLMVVRERPWQLRIPAEPNPSVISYPVGAAAYLRDTGFAGNVMTPFNVGAYVSWMLHPAVRVSLDSRYEVAYPPALVEESAAFYAGRGDWRATLQRYPTNAVLVDVEAPLLPLMRAAQQTSGWREIYRDRGYSIFAPSMP